MYKALGFLFVGLASLGVFLPVLPCTPFLLLAAACFSKSSKKWYNWLLNNKTFGGMIRDWEEHRCIARRSKNIALFSIITFGGYSVFFALSNLYAKVGTCLILLCGIFVVSKLKVCKK